MTQQTDIELALIESAHNAAEEAYHDALLEGCNVEEALAEFERVRRALDAAAEEVVGG